MPSSVSSTRSLFHTLENYYTLTKPGLVYGNAVAAAAGFFLAAHTYGYSFPLLILSLLGTIGIIAAGGVFNNYADRHLDSMMQRTQDRPLVQGTVRGTNALLYGIFLALGGLFILFFYVNVLTAIVGLVALLLYAGIYTPLKRTHTFAVYVGALAGAAPPVMGYFAVAGSLDIAALLLFFLLFTWQLPHFFSIALYHQEDYEKARVPLLPLRHSLRVTRFYINGYIILFALVGIVFFMQGYAGQAYLFSLLALSGLWYAVSIFGLKFLGLKKWARTLFFLSLLVLFGTAISLVLNAQSPHLSSPAIQKH